MGGIRFQALGPLEAKRDGRRVALGGPKQRAVLALLLADAGRVVSTDRIVDAIWGDTLEDLSGAVQVYVAKLRKALDPERTESPPGLIETVRPGYRLTPSGSSFDVTVFESLAADGRNRLGAGRHQQALEALEGALALWRGPFAEDLVGFGFVAEEADRLERVRHAVCVDMLECLLGLGRHGDVVPQAEQLAVAEPYDERVTSILMRALYRAGRQTDALATYRRLEQTLLDELGLQPGPELQQMELRILEQDPALLSDASRTVSAHTTIRHGFGAEVRAFLTRDGEALPLIRSVTTIGRLPDRIVVVDDPGVSRRHAEIRITGEGFQLVDTGSTNGTFVNGLRVADRLLADEDVITVGTAEMVFHLGGSEPGPDAEFR